MKRTFSHIILPLIALFFVTFGCMKDELLKEDLSLSDQLGMEEGSVPVITYQDGEVIPGQYIVVYREDAFPNQRQAVTKANYMAMKGEVAERTQAVLRENNISEKQLLQTYAKTVHGFALQLTDEEVESLRQDRRIAYLEQDQIVSLTMGGPPGGGGGGGQETPDGITRVGGGASGVGKTAWILDTGIDLDHPDLNVNVAESISFITSGSNASSPDDQNGHGSHVAGTVAAINNTVGVIGVAAGASVVAVRVLDRRGSGTISGVIAGVDYVGANASNGDAANMSLTGGGSTTLDDAVKAASNSCPFALAAGNNGANVNNYSPARANGPNIYTISAMDSSDNWASFSNYGTAVDYCAPGVSIKSTWKDGGYNTISGTSMATPHVCGLLLLGNVSSDGTVNNDPDGDPDPIAHR